MCLIHNIKPDTLISNAWLKNIFSKNSDGIGAMLIEDGQMVVKKYIPKNFRKALRWFRANVEGRAGVVHWRYATHGAVNLDNAHPYPVLTKEEDGIDLYMMHNGVMDEFDEDTTLEDLYQRSYYRGGHGKRWLMGAEVDDRSDTYHFIRCVILPLVRPELGGTPDNVFNPAVQALIASHIGHGNKLVFMDTDCRTAFINGQEFVKWEYYDLVCSNTYAWDSVSSKYDSPRARGPLVMGDPRKFTGSATTARSSSAVQRSAILPASTVAPTNPQSRYYENEIVPFGWDKIEADDDEFEPDAEDKEWIGAKKEASDWWDQLNMTNSRITSELTERDVAIYIHAKGSDAMTDITNQMWAGQLTDLEYVDEVLDTAHIARKSAIA